MPSKSARAPPPPPEAPASPPPPPPPPSPLVTEAHVLRATRTVFDARGVAPSWSDASWLCVSDFGVFGDDADGPARETAWAQVGPWGAFALVSAFQLETDTWNALRFAARVSRSEFRVGWDLIDTPAQTSGSPVTPPLALEPPPPPLNPDSANETSPRFFSRRAALLVDAEEPEPEEEEEYSSSGSVSAPFDADGWYEPWTSPSQTQTSFDPSLWREVFVPLDRALFVTGEPKASSASWNRLSWRDVSGFGGEIQLRDVRLESWAIDALSIDDDTGEPNVTPSVRTAYENGTSEASARLDPYASAPPAPAAPALAYGTQSRERGDDASGAEGTVVVVPSAPVEGASDTQLVLVALFVVLFVALAFVAACAVALLSRRAARRGRGGAGAKDEERGGEAFGSSRRRLREGVDSAGVATRFDSLVSIPPARPFRTSSSSRAPRRRPPPGPRRAASASDADAAFAPRREKRRDADASPSTSARRLGVFSPRKSVSRTPSAQCSAGDSSTGGDFGGVLRGADQPGVVNITADALALALETTADVSAASSVSAASFESKSSSRSAHSGSVSETDASDEPSEKGSSLKKKETAARFEFEALTASQFEADVALGAVLGKGAFATVRAGTWTRRPGELTTAGRQPGVFEKPVPVFEKKQVAVKLFEPVEQSCVDASGASRGASFENELRVLRRIGGGKPSRLVAALAACDDAPRVRAILMPLLDGGSLHDALRRAAETENPYGYGAFPLAARLRALTHVASALRYLHDMKADFGVQNASRDPSRERNPPGSRTQTVSVAHLDVKPKNVLLDARTGNAKLADFGSATLVASDPSDAVGRAVDDADADASDVDAAVDAMLDDAFSETTPSVSGDVSETVIRKPPGTINYMAPELFEGAATTPSADDVCFLAPASRETRSAFLQTRLLTRCDAWSFAMTAYETVTGSVPWRGLTPTQIVELVGVKDERPRGLGDPERVSDWLGDADASDGERKIFAAAFHEHLVGKCVEKCWARDPHDRPLFAETLARLRRLRRGLANRGLAKASKASKDAETFFFPSARRTTARRERSANDDASYGAAVPRSASSFASASLELSSASE